MSLRVRLTLLIALLTLLPAVPAALVTRELIGHGLGLALQPELEEALRAGVRQTRERLRAERAEGEAWLLARLEEAPSPGDASLFRPQARVRSLDPGERLPSPVPEQGPPRWQRVEARGPDGRRWRLEWPVSEIWREDATRLAEAWQLVAGLRAERAALERGFWRTFLWIYVVALALGVGAALWLGRGLAVGVARLVRATDAVAAGDWSVRIPSRGGGELRRLGDRFNAMVTTLHAQSRRLADLQAMEGWREMARALAHEVKNPLTPIQLTVEEMRERYRGDDEEYRHLLRECTRIVVEEVASLRRVVTRFREFSRPVELAPRELELGPLLRDVATLQPDLAVELRLDASLGRLEADEDRLRQLLLNLFENARGLGARRMRLEARGSESAVELTVEDDGPGVPVEERPRIFDPYRSGRAGGLGLGLALGKGIVLAHGGTIDVDEGIWGGARFRVELPRRLRAPAQEVEHGAHPDRR